MNVSKPLYLQSSLNDMFILKKKRQFTILHGLRPGLLCGQGLLPGNQQRQVAMPISGIYQRWIFVLSFDWKWAKCWTTLNISVVKLILFYDKLTHNIFLNHIITDLKAFPKIYKQLCKLKTFTLSHENKKNHKYDSLLLIILDSPFILLFCFCNGLRASEDEDAAPPTRHIWA